MKIIILFLCLCLFFLGATALYADPPPVLKCYQCKKEHCNSACNLNTEECKDKETVCETITQWDGFKYYEVSKGCKKPKANSQLGCKKEGQKRTCRDECSDNLCNRSLAWPVKKKK